jgi:hypothetical protein
LLRGYPQRVDLHISLRPFVPAEDTGCRSHGDSNVTRGKVAASVLEGNAIAAIVKVARVTAPVHITLALLCGEQTS